MQVFGVFRKLHHTGIHMASFRELADAKAYAMLKAEQSPLPGLEYVVVRYEHEVLPNGPFFRRN